MSPIDAHLAAVTPGEWLRYCDSAPFSMSLHDWHRIDQRLHGEDQPLVLPADTQPCWTCNAARRLLVPPGAR